MKCPTCNHELSAGSFYPPFVVWKTRRGGRYALKLEAKDIVAIKSFKQYAEVRMRDGSMHMTETPLIEFERIYKDLFTRVHRNALIRFDDVVKVGSIDCHWHAYFKVGEPIKIARRMWSRFRELFTQEAANETKGLGRKARRSFKGARRAMLAVSESDGND